jgi:hypothetical protein
VKPFPLPLPQDMYAWNYFLTREFEGCLHSVASYCWVMPIIRGNWVDPSFVATRLHFEDLMRHYCSPVESFVG